MIRIRQAVYEDIPKIMRFIDEHWKKGHIMGNDRTMFEFQHVRDGEVFYIIAEDDTDGRIYGSMGYIPMMEQKWPCMSTVMIQSLNNPENRMLGEEMARYFEKNMQCYNLFSVGIEQRYAKAIAALGGNIEKLNHYYRLGQKQEFKIARINHYHVLPIKKDGITLVPLETAAAFEDQIDKEQLHHNYPRKSLRYITHRYYCHPYYSYKIWGLQSNDGIKSAIATREEEVNGSKVLRVVDFFGRDADLALAGHEIDKLLAEENYEYIDFYCYGIDDSILQDAGFSLRNETDDNIIPNYFDPFSQKNIDIYFYTWYLPNIHVYRGFGDQDRPNHIINHKKGELTMKELLEMLEEIMDMEEGTLETTTVLTDLEEWDSLSKLSLMAEAKKTYQKKLSADEIAGFVTVQNIFDYLHK